MCFAAKPTKTNQHFFKLLLVLYYIIFSVHRYKISRRYKIDRVAIVGYFIQLIGKQSSSAYILVRNSWRLSWKSCLLSIRINSWTKIFDRKTYSCTIWEIFCYHPNFKYKILSFWSFIKNQNRVFSSVQKPTIK